MSVMDGLPVQPSYREVRDSFPGGEDSHNDPTVGTLWRGSDRWREHIRDDVAKVVEDPDLSEEGKEKKIADIHERLGPKVQRDAKKAKEKALKRAEEYGLRGIPMPGGTMMGASIKDSTELLAVQNEANAIAEQCDSVGLADKIAERRGGGAGARPKNIKGDGNPKLERLQGFFREAMQGSGFEARVKAHATLRAAQKLGIAPEHVYQPFMEDRHRDALEESLHYFTAANMIDTSAPSPDRGRVAGGSHWKRAGTPRTGGTIFKKQRRPSWK